MVAGAFRAAAEWSDDGLRRGDFRNIRVFGEKCGGFVRNSFIFNKADLAGYPTFWYLPGSPLVLPGTSGSLLRCSFLAAAERLDDRLRRAFSPVFYLWAKNR